MTKTWTVTRYSDLLKMYYTTRYADADFDVVQREANMKLSERMRRFVGSPGAVAEDWADEVAALEDELASARQWAKAWKRFARIARFSNAYRRTAALRTLQQRDSARRVARALYAVYQTVDAETMECSNPQCMGSGCLAMRSARRVLAQEARDG